MIATTTFSTLSSASGNASNHFLIPGVNYNFAPTAERDSRIREQINSGQIDFMDEIAKMFARSLSYGRDINDCKTVRSQNMYGFGMLEEDWLPWLFGMLVGLLVF